MGICGYIWGMSEDLGLMGCWGVIYGYMWL